MLTVCSAILDGLDAGAESNGLNRYNSIMKMLFIGTTLAIVYQIRFKRTVKVTYDKDRDTFRSELLIGVSVLIAFLVHERIHGKGFFHYLQEVRPYVLP